MLLVYLLWLPVFTPKFFFFLDVVLTTFEMSSVDFSQCCTHWLLNIFVSGKKKKKSKWYVSMVVGWNLEVQSPGFVGPGEPDD